ncbi:MAG TPA: hypothetical protein VHD56_18080 [Tepidisphaeraceae bacterium]|nr:hypothetical protein [Tepidisphaeraceae bacterium]
MSRIKIIAIGAVMLVVLLGVVWEGFKWSVMRVYVAPNEALVVINKFGDSLPGELVVVPPEQNSFKGVEQNVLGPGRYFLNPVEYDHKIVPLVQIPAGSPEKWSFTGEGTLADPALAPQIGLVTLKQGQTPPAGS